MMREESTCRSVRGELAEAEAAAIAAEEGRAALQYTSVYIRHIKPSCDFPAWRSICGVPLWCSFVAFPFRALLECHTGLLGVPSALD